MNGNRLRLGLFGANCSSGRTYASLPERWDASWENNLRLAQMADEIGIGLADRCAADHRTTLYPVGLREDLTHIPHAWGATRPGRRDPSF